MTGPNNARAFAEQEYAVTPSPPRPLRRLRRALVWSGALTAVFVAAACRLEAAGRVVAVVGAVLCLAAWSSLLEREGRASERLERRVARRPTTRAAGRGTRQRNPAPRRRAA